MCTSSSPVVEVGILLLLCWLGLRVMFTPLPSVLSPFYFGVWQLFAFYFITEVVVRLATFRINHGRGQRERGMRIM